MPRFACNGWWEQDGFGRQPMQKLEFEFSGTELTGRGTDVVGDFVLTVAIAGEHINLIKQYVGQHQIEYRGTCGGEGIYSGS